MKQARRVYLKHKHSGPHQSPSFKSNVQRPSFDFQSLKEDPGPGSYQITLPIVKPKFEAIFKNNRSIIVRFNDVPSAPFSSNQERFRQKSPHEPIRTQKLVDLKEIQSKRVKNSRRYDFKMVHKKSFEEVSNQKSNKTINKNGDNQTIRGTQWSKYKEIRKLWNAQKSIQNPGPGSYNSTFRKKNNNQLISWQFKSETGRKFIRSLSQNQRDEHKPQNQYKVNSIHSQRNSYSIQY